MKTKKKVEKKAAETIDVRNFIRVDMVFDGDSSKGWVHTHGMWETFNLPDLEIVRVEPLFLMSAAGMMLNHIAQYMVDGQMGLEGTKELKLGQTFGMDRVAIVKFELSTPLDKDDHETHYSTPRWRAVPVPGMFICAHPKHKGEKL